MSDSTDVLAEIEEGLRKHRPGANPSWCVACSDFDTNRRHPCDAAKALTGWKQAEEEKRALLIATENAESGLSGIVESGDFQMPDHTAFNLQGVLDDIREALLAAKESK